MNAALPRDMDDLPGADLIRDGLADLAAGRETVASLLVAIGRPRLNLLGIACDFAGRFPADPESRLYRLLCESHDNEAHSQYNAFIRRLASFERALERRMSAKARGT